MLLQTTLFIEYNALQKSKYCLRLHYGMITYNDQYINSLADVHLLKNASENFNCCTCALLFFQLSFATIRFDKSNYENLLSFSDWERAYLFFQISRFYLHTSLVFQCKLYSCLFVYFE